MHRPATLVIPALVAALSAVQVSAQSTCYTGPTGKVTIDSYAPRHIALSAKASGPALVVLADAWDAGWVARVNGEEVPVERVDHSLRGVWIDAGSSSIEFSHEPSSIRIGLACGAVGVLASLLLLLRRPR